MGRAVGLEFVAGPHVIPIRNTDWDDLGFGKGAAKNIAEYVTREKLVEKHEVEQWVAELEESGRNGTFFFNINRYVYVGVKSNEQNAKEENLSKRSRLGEVDPLADGKRQQMD